MLSNSLKLFIRTWNIFPSMLLPCWCWELSLLQSQLHLCCLIACTLHLEVQQTWWVSPAWWEKMCSSSILLPVMQHWSSADQHQVLSGLHQLLLWWCGYQLHLWSSHQFLLMVELLVVLMMMAAVVVVVGAHQQVCPNHHRSKVIV